VADYSLKKNIPFEKAREELNIPPLDQLWDSFSQTPDQNRPEPQYAPSRPVRRSRQRGGVLRYSRPPHLQEELDEFLSEIDSPKLRGGPVRFCRRFVSTSVVVVHL